jgi:transcriptional regulator with PAS, ATPase and Fis domain
MENADRVLSIENDGTVGEAGTGKQFVVRAPHECSRRKDRTFLKLNCAGGAAVSSAGEGRKSTDVPPDTLTRQRALLDGLFARVPEAIVLLDADHRILQVDPEFTMLFGYAQGEACGSLLDELVVPKNYGPRRTNARAGGPEEKARTSKLCGSARMAPAFMSR